MKNNNEEKEYDLNKLYGDEKPLDRYRRLTVGENTSIWNLISQELALGFTGGLPGIVGYAFRNRLYSWMFRGISKKAFLGRNVTLRCPRQIELSSGVIIDDYSQLIATSRDTQAIKLGDNCFVRSFAMINAGPPDGYVHIGRDSGIGQGTILYGNGGLTIGNKVLIAGQCYIVASSHTNLDNSIPIADQGYTAKGISIEDNVWVGAGVKILDGVTIGSGSVIGANAVVTTSIPPDSKVVGIPAKQIS